MVAQILIIEDNEANLELVHYLLEKAGYRLSVAVDGAEGVAVALRVRPDLIVCDLQMPVMDGYEVLRRLRAAAGFAAIPIVAVTAYSMPDDQRRVKQAGFDGYLSKPIEPETFVASIEAFLAPPLRARGAAPQR